jgi:conjugal transfer pilus assembly protein TraF
MRDLRLILLGGLLLFLSQPALAAVYGSEAKRGWWWYEDPPAQEGKKGPEKEVASAPPAYTPEELWNLHPDAFQEYAEGVKKEAVRDPSEAKVKHYYEVQEVARKKALAFANASEYIWQKHPELTVAKDYPVAAPGRNALTRQQVEERDRVIRSAREDFALLYFHSLGCSFCTEQEGILGYFLGKFGWTVKRIDIDREPATAGRFNIVTTPTLLLIHRGTPDSLPISAGVASATEIEEKLYRGIRLLRGEIGPADFNLYEFQRGGGFDPGAGRGLSTEAR